MKKILLVLGILALSVGLKAQTVPTIVYDFSAALTEVQAYTHLVTVDGTALATPTCVSAGTTKTTCSVPAPTLATGTHNIVISATRGGTTQQAVLNGWSVTGGPKPPENPRAVITIIIQVQ